MSGKIVGSVRGQVLHLIYPPLVEGTVDYLTAEFSFSGDWDGLSKWAHFKQGSTIYDVPLTNDAITEDQHLNLSAGTWDVYLHGSGDNRRITTTTVRMKVLPYLDEDGEPLPEVPLTFAEVLDQRAQRIQAVAYAVEAGESARKEAERSRELSEFARVQAEAERTGAEAGRASAETERSSAETARKNAEQTRVSAENSRSSAEDTRKTNEEARQAAEAIREQNEEARVEAEKNRKDGITPHIGDNGNWYLGDTDTGKPSRGGDGGWYTPSVTQPDENTLRMAFTPSKDDMPDVAHTDIMLPGGGSGSVAVDSTLTVSGQAADAKVTGDAIRSLSDEKVDKDYIDLKKYGISAAEYEAPFTAEMYEVAYANGVGIQNAINDAKARGMERITLPAGNYPLCYHAAADEEYNAIIDASGIDFYGYGVKLYVIYDEEGTNPYFTGATPRLLQGTIISTDRDVCGFHLVGERRFRQDENTKFRDKSCGIALTSTTNGNTIKDCVVECISGDGIGAGVHMEQVGGWTPDTFTSIEWNYETGAYVESNYMYTSAEHTTDWLDLSRPLLVRCTGYFLYSARPLIIRCFDSDGTYIGVVQFWQGEYFYLPENTAKWRLELTRVVEHETTATETWSWWMGYGTFSGTKIINCESRLNQRGGMSNLPNDVLVKDCYIHNNGNAGDGMMQYYDTTRFGIDIEDIWIHRITIDGCRIVDNFNCLLFRCGSVVVKNSIITNVHAMNQVVDFHAEQSVFQEDITWIAPTPFGNKVAIGCTFGGAVPDSLSVIGAGGGLSEAEVTALIESYIDTGVVF